MAFRCDACHRTFESGPFQTLEKTHQADPKPTRKTIAA
jgi:hypothetical protein